jgi:uncharacterized protein YqgC (DUF456 family)
MSLEQILGLLVALALMGVGLAGCVVPGLPGTPLVLIAAVAHRLWFGPASVSNIILALLVLLTLISLALDYLAGVAGARGFGATWRGVLGAAVGALIGLFFGPVGLLVGPFLGATGFEWLSGREFRQAGRAGFGAFLGMLGGAVGKVACCLAMIGLFAADVVWRS